MRQTFFISVGKHANIELLWEKWKNLCFLYPYINFFQKIISRLLKGYTNIKRGIFEKIKKQGKKEGSEERGEGRERREKRTREERKGKRRKERREEKRKGEGKGK